jgi:xylose isomerase
VKYAIILGNLGNTNDRFLSSGYKDQPTKEEMIKRAAAIEGVEGVELVGPGTSLRKTSRRSAACCRSTT